MGTIEHQSATDVNAAESAASPTGKLELRIGERICHMVTRRFQLVEVGVLVGFEREEGAAGDRYKSRERPAAAGD